MIFINTAERFSELNKAMVIKLVSPHIDNLSKVAKAITQSKFKNKNREGIWKVSVTDIPDKEDRVVTFTYKRLAVKYLVVESQESLFVQLFLDGKRYHHSHVLFEEEQYRLTSFKFVDLDDVAKPIKQAIAMMRKNNEPDSKEYLRSNYLEKRLTSHVKLFKRLNKALNL